MTTVSIPRKAVLAFAGVASAVTGCSGDADADKSGGQGSAEPVTLVMAQPNHEPPDQLASWAEEVGRLSGGTLTIEFENLWRGGEPAYEAGTIEDVQAGTVDLAWVGARAFDMVDVNSFQALVAPMLIDSHDLQAAVFDAGIPVEMMAGLDEADLAGIGVLPGPMFKVLGIDQPFVAPADFAGAVVGIQQSGVATQSMAAVGATTLDLPTGADLDGVDAYAQQLSSITGNQYWNDAEYVTANVNLWPRPLVLFMNDEAFDALDSDQQAALRDAAEAATPGAFEASRGEDRDGAAELCTQGLMSLAEASDDDLAALREAFDSVYAELATDSATSGYLDAIATLKEELGAAPDSPDLTECAALASASGADTSSAGEASPIDGVYEVTTTADDVRAAGDNGPSVAENWGDWTYVLDGGRFAFTQENDEACTWGYGTYEIDGDQVAWTFLGGGGEAPNDSMNRPGEVFVFGWSVFENTLSLSAVPGEVSPEPFRALPWRQTSTTPTAGALSTRCPPPPEALDGDSATDQAPVNLDGTYEWTLTDEDAVASGTPSDQTPRALEEWFPSTFTVVLHNGDWTMTQSADPEIGDGTYTAFRDQIVFDWDGNTLTFMYVADDDGNLTLTAVEPMDDGDRFVWTTHAWTRVD